MDTLLEKSSKYSYKTMVKPFGSLFKNSRRNRRMSASEQASYSDRGFDKLFDKKAPADQKYECARARCPMNLDGKVCANSPKWFTCVRQIEP